MGIIGVTNFWGLNPFAFAASLWDAFNMMFGEHENHRHNDGGVHRYHGGA